MDMSVLDHMAERLPAVLDDARRRGAAAGKIVCSRREQVECGFENARLKDTKTARRMSLRVELIVDGRQGRASCNRPDDLDEMVTRALTLAGAGSQVHFDAYPPPSPTTAVATWSPRTAGLTTAQLVDAGQSICDQLKARDPDMMIYAYGTCRQDAGVLATTGGVLHRAAGTSWSLHGQVQRTRETDMLFAGYGRSWRDLNDWFDPHLIVDRTCRDLDRAETTAEPPKGAVTALLSPEVVQRMLYAVRMGVNGRNVAKADSPLQDRLGEQVLADSITVRDDPHADYANGACEMSSDGIPTRRMNIIDAGVLQGFLYDLDSAGLAGARPTGHDGCAPWSLDVPGGRTPHDRMLRDISDGLYIKGLIGFGQSNLMNGDFSCNVALGFRVRQGRIVGRVKNTMVAGNVYDLLGRDVVLSSDRDPAERMPYMRVEGLSVGAA